LRLDGDGLEGEGAACTCAAAAAAAACASLRRSRCSAAASAREARWVGVRIKMAGSMRRWRGCCEGADCWLGLRLVLGG
jgi:hypothetical protein